MSSLTPTGTVTHLVPSLGEIKGLEFPGGIRQFCGIPYAELSKRWTRSTLKTSLSGHFHDATQHGPICPQPPEYPDLIGGLVPIKPMSHFTTPGWDELNCLNVNIVMPPQDLPGPHPVMLRWKALLQHFGIDTSAVDALDQLRAVSQQESAHATCLIEGTMGTTGNPCDDGWYHSQPPSVSTTSSPPAWLKSYMVGDVADEAIIFRQMIADETYDTLKASLLRFIQASEMEAVLNLYGVGPDTPAEELRFKLEDMATDACFTLQNRIHASVSKVSKTFAFHMDQLATFGFPLDGLAPHAVDVAYFFMNLTDKLTPSQQKLGEKMADDLLDFAWGKSPWSEYGQSRKYMVYGPNDEWAVKTESEDELARGYEKMDSILQMGGNFLDRWIEAIDYVVNKRWLQKSTEYFVETLYGA